MRVFTFISKAGDGLPLAMRIANEGHRAIFYINEKDKRLVGQGLVEKSTVKPELINREGKIDKSVLSEILYPKPDCIVMDMVGWGYGELANLLRSRGYPVIGGSKWGDQVELDRKYGSRIMTLYNINTPKVYNFLDYGEAIAFVKQKGVPLVYKPSGNQPTTTTYVAEKADDLIGMLEFYSGIKEEFQLQEKVSGVEVSTELWFNGSEVLSVNHTMEEKTLLEGGLGPKTGSMGDVVWIGTQNSKLYREGVGKLVPALKKVSYRGPIDLNTIVTKDRLYGLEFTARFGYNALFDLLELYSGKVNDLFYGVASGVAKEMKFRGGYGLGVNFALEPYPMVIEPQYSKDILVQGINPHNLKHLWFYDIMKKGKRYMCSGNGGNLGVVTARGESVREAKRRAYRTLSNLIIPDVMYRRDIGARVENDIAQLRGWGWL